MSIYLWSFMKVSNIYREQTRYCDNNASIWLISLHSNSLSCMGCYDRMCKTDICLLNSEFTKGWEINSKLPKVYIIHYNWALIENIKKWICEISVKIVCEMAGKYRLQRCTALMEGWTLWRWQEAPDDGWRKLITLTGNTKVTSVCTLQLSDSVHQERCWDRLQSDLRAIRNNERTEVETILYDQSGSGQIYSIILCFRKVNVHGTWHLPCDILISCKLLTQCWWCRQKYCVSLWYAQNIHFEALHLHPLIQYIKCKMF